MAHLDQPFRARLKRIERRRTRVAERGGRLVMREDGLLTVSPRRPRPRFPFALALALVAAGLLFKATSLHVLGAAGYAGRVEALEAGSWADRAGAFLLQADPVTQSLAALLAGISAL